MEFSVLMSAYKNTKSNEFIDCFESLLNQTILPNEIIVVLDGEISDDLKDTLQKYLNESSSLLKLVQLENNVGLALALNEGLKHCTYDLVARMDTDDLCFPERFEKQLRAFEEDIELDMVGTCIYEFIDNSENIVSKRLVPLLHEEIVAFMKKRNPFNHMSVMFKKKAIEKAGGYLHLNLYEDYYLWVRMYLVGCKFKNLDDILIKMRIDENTYKRRGGYKYYKNEKYLFKYMLKNRMISIFSYWKSNTTHFIARVLLPNSIRAWLYKRVLRKNT